MRQVSRPSRPVTLPVLWLSATLAALVLLNGCSSLDPADAQAKRRELALDYLISLTAPPDQAASKESPSSTGETEKPGAAQGKSGPLPIDLPAALRLADAQNYKIAVAREKIAEAAARYDRAKVLLLPTLSVGAGFNRHDGQLQETDGNVMQVRRTSKYAGLGAGAVGAGAPQIPGLSVTVDLADAIFEPLAARQNVLAAEAGDRVATNQTLLDVTLAYYDLVRAKSTLDIAGETHQNAKNLAEVTANFAKAGEGLESDSERAAVEQLVREKELEEAREAFQVESARLAQLLRLDPRVQLLPGETNIVPVRIVPEDRLVEDMIVEALVNHPEHAQKQALADLAYQRSRQAKFDPLLPKIALTYSAGYFDGRDVSEPGHEGDRRDMGMLLYWRIANLGFADRARMRQMDSVHRQAELERLGAMDRIASEVVQASAQSDSRQKQIPIGALAVEHAQRSLKMNLTRIYERQGLPLEALQAIQSLALTRKSYLDSVVDYNQAQFRLYTAIGQPLPEELTEAEEPK